MSPQQILTTVMTRIVVDKSTYHAKPHSICFYHNINGKERQRKCFSSERDQDRDTKKEEALSITFSQSDWFISQNERF